MKILNFTEYCADYHKLLRQIWTNNGYDKWSSHHPSWLEFKVDQYELYLSEVAKWKNASFEEQTHRLNPKWRSHDPEYTIEKLEIEIDSIVSMFLKHNKKTEPIWLLRRRLLKK